MYINKVLLYGNITKDIELKSTQNGTTVCSFSVATNRRWKDKNGAQQEDAQFHNCVAWGKTAELIHQFLGKGSAIMIEGRLQTRNYEAKDGSKRYVTEVVVENMQFGPKGGQKADQGTEGNADTSVIDAGDDIAADDLPF